MSENDDAVIADEPCADESELLEPEPAASAADEITGTSAHIVDDSVDADAVDSKIDSQKLSHQLRTSRRKMMKMKAEKDGSKIIPLETACLRVQARYRGRKVRRMMRLSCIAAIIIQRFFRGFLDRKAFKRAHARTKELKLSEIERVNRFRRIRQRERDLAMLRRIPAADSLNLERLRRESSARTLQRAWHKSIGAHWKPALNGKKDDVSTGDDLTPSGRSTAEQVRKSILTEALVNATTASQLKITRPDYYSMIASRIGVEALGLAQIHRRVKDKASQKGKEKDRVLEDSNARADMDESVDVGEEGQGARPPSRVAERGERGERGVRGGVRKKYQELLEIQQKCSVYMEEYWASNAIRKSRKVDRLTSLGHCDALVHELLHPQSLDQAAAAIRQEGEGRGSSDASHKTMSSWMVDLSLSNIQQSVDAHLRITSAMHDKKRWSLVAAPHDVTGPPIDIYKLEDSVIDESSHIRRRFPAMANDWADGRDVEKSLWWVSYAAQDRAMPTDKTAPALKENPNQIAARELLGEVEGAVLLRQLSKQAIGAGKRRAEVRQQCDGFARKVQRLADVFQLEALKLLKAKIAGATFQNLSSQDTLRRHSAASRIQALMRGAASRKSFRIMQSEHRVLLALQSLVHELTRPEMKSSGLSLGQIDAALMHRVQSLQRGPGVSVQKHSARPSIDKQSTPRAERLGPTDVSSTDASFRNPSRAAPMTVHSHGDESVTLPRTNPHHADDLPSINNVSSEAFGSDEHSIDMLSPRSGAASQIQRMYRARQKFGSNKQSADHASSGAVRTEAPAEELLLLTPYSTGKSAGISASGASRRTSSPSPRSSSKKSSGKQSRAPPAFYSSGGVGVDQSPAKTESKRWSQRDADSRTKKKLDRTFGSGSGEEFLTELEDSLDGLDGYISSPSISQSGAAESMSSMFLDMQQTGAASPSHLSLPDYRRTKPAASAYHTLSKSISSTQRDINLRVPNLSVGVVECLAAVSFSFKNNQLEVQELVENSLLSNLAVFSKPSALVLLQGIANICGIEQLRVWLGGYATNALDLSLESSVDISESYRSRGPELVGKTTALLLCELCLRLNLLADGDQSTYRLVNLCMLVRLLCGGGSGKVKLAELMMLVEDMWLINNGSDGVNVSFMLAQARYSLLYECIKTSTASDTLFDKATATFHSESLEINDVIKLFMVLGLHLNRSEATAVVRIVDGSNDAQALRAENLKGYLCSLCSFRALQKRIQIWFRAVPMMMNSIFTEIAALTGIDGPLSAYTAVPFEQFCEAVQQSNIPLSESETFCLAKLLSRSSADLLHDTGVVQAALLDKIRKGEFLSMRLQ